MCRAACNVLQILAIIELFTAPKGLYKDEVYLLPKKMGGSHMPCKLRGIEKRERMGGREREGREGEACTAHV